MFPRNPRKLYDEYKDAIVKVTEEEFLRLWTEAGGSEEDGKFQLQMSKSMGSSIGIKGTLYTVQ